MITLDAVKRPDGNQLFFYNITTRVGGTSTSQPIDIKLVQWYLFIVATRCFSDISFDISQVNGVWDADCQAALGIYEKEADVLEDGLVDPMPPGVFAGSISHKVYKLINFASQYFRSRVLSGQFISQALDSGTVSVDDVNDVMITMRDEPLMPPDLAAALTFALTHNPPPNS